MYYVHSHSLHGQASYLAGRRNRDRSPSGWSTFGAVHHSLARPGCAAQRRPPRGRAVPVARPSLASPSLRAAPRHACAAPEPRRASERGAALCVSPPHPLGGCCALGARRSPVALVVHASRCRYVRSAPPAKNARPRALEWAAQEGKPHLGASYQKKRAEEFEFCCGPPCGAPERPRWVQVRETHTGCPPLPAPRSSECPRGAQESAFLVLSFALYSFLRLLAASHVCHADAPPPPGVPVSRRHGHDGGGRRRERHGHGGCRGRGCGRGGLWSSTHPSLWRLCRARGALGGLAQRSGAGGGAGRGEALFGARGTLGGRCC